MTIDNSANVPRRPGPSGAAWIIIALVVAAAIVVFLFYAVPQRSVTGPTENNVNVEQTNPPPATGDATQPAPADNGTAPSTAPAPQPEAAPATPPAPAPADQQPATNQ